MLTAKLTICFIIACRIVKIDTVYVPKEIRLKNSVVKDSEEGLTWSDVLAEIILREIKVVLFGKNIERVNLKKMSIISIFISECLKLCFNEIYTNKQDITTDNGILISPVFDRRVAGVPSQCPKGFKADQNKVCRQIW